MISLAQRSCMLLNLQQDVLVLSHLAERRSIAGVVSPSQQASRSTSLRLRFCRFSVYQMMHLFRSVRGIELLVQRRNNFCGSRENADSGQIFFCSRSMEENDTTITFKTRCLPAAMLSKRKEWKGNAPRGCD